MKALTTYHLRVGGRLFCSLPPPHVILLLCVRRSAPGWGVGPLPARATGCRPPVVPAISRGRQWESLRSPGDPSCAFAPLLDPGRIGVFLLRFGLAAPLGGGNRQDQRRRQRQQRQSWRHGPVPWRREAVDRGGRVAAAPEAFVVIASGGQHRCDRQGKGTSVRTGSRSGAKAQDGSPGDLRDSHWRPREIAGTTGGRHPVARAGRGPYTHPGALRRTPKQEDHVGRRKANKISDRRRANGKS